VPEESIFYKDMGDTVEYIAKHTGYLAINSADKLEIISPSVVSTDELFLYYLVIPVIYGNVNLIKDFYEKIEVADTQNDKDDLILVKTRKEEGEISDILKSGLTGKKLLRHGLAPVPTVHGLVHVYIKQDFTEAKDKADKIDYKKITPYHEVNEGALIARKIKAVQGTPGLNVLNKILPVEKVKDENFNAGQNIVKEENEQEILYKAGISGILDLSSDHASITEDLQIKGDVDLNTGNLKSSKSILIGGNVKGGFSVESAKDIVIEGNVEDGAVVSCRGNLTIKGGIFGKKATVSAGGKAVINFVQEGNLRASGDLLVENYLYTAKVFCKGNLIVDGKKAKTQERRGAVLAGEINSMGSMSLHSVGSPAIITDLICGINQDAKKKKVELENVLPILKKEIARLQNNIGFDLSRDDVVEVFKALPAIRKKIIHPLIEKLQQAVKQREDVLSAIKKLDAASYADDLHDLHIDIQHQLVPDVYIRMADSEKTIQTAMSKVRFSLKEDRTIEIATILG